METSDNPPVAGKKSPRRRESVKKWTRAVMGAGYTMVPMVLLSKQHELGLDAVDMNILLQLLGYWWKADQMPYPSKETLAKRIGVDASTIRRRIASLEQRGFLKRETRADSANGQRPNLYDLRPLVDKLHPHGVEAAKEKKERKARRRQSTTD